ncbi:hypothetical protein JH26_02060 [Microvirga sp. BSC39]|nr:hypothetical protein JH26_02060 [Microvirga sp. BSC39]
MEISWDDVNRTGKTGIHFVTGLGIEVFVSQRAIENWRSDPEGRHHMVEIATSLRKIYSLGTLELAENSGPG